MRVASAICTIDRAANHRLDPDVVDREIPALGALIALNAWVFHSFCATGAGTGAVASAPPILWRCCQPL